MANLARKTIEIKSKSVPITFSVLIAKYQVKNNFVTVRDIYKKKFSKKIKEEKIGESLFYSYCNGSSVPGLVNAEYILNTLKIKYTKKELENLLEISNDEKIKYNYNRFSATVSFTYRSICSFIEEEELINGLLEQRIAIHGKGSFSQYIAKLIKQDLENSFNKSKEEN